MFLLLNFKILAHIEGVQKGTRMRINLGLNWRFRNPKIRTKTNIDKNLQISIFFNVPSLDIKTIIFQCSDLEVPAKTRGKSHDLEFYPN